MSALHSALVTRKRQNGMTLVELMVALTLGLLLVTVVSLSYVQSALGTRHSTLASQMNEDAALALELVRSQLRLTAYSEPDADGKRLFRELPITGCDGGFTSASDAGGFGALACDGGSGSDAIAVRYQATLLNSQTITGAGFPQPVPGNCVNNGITATLVGGVAVAIADNRFYIAKDGTNENAPTLYCRGGNGTGFTAAALVPNIEDMQLRYVITRRPVEGAPPPQQVTATVTASDLPSNDWTRVAAVELCLVARSARPAPKGSLSSQELTRYLDCNGVASTANDGYLRRAYRTLVPLPNVRPAIPQPYKLDGGLVANPFADPS